MPDTDDLIARLHGDIANLPPAAGVIRWSEDMRVAYTKGHRDARHTAAGLAQRHMSAALSALQEELRTARFLIAVLEGEQARADVLAEALAELVEEVGFFLRNFEVGKPCHADRMRDSADRARAALGEKADG